jgi:transposase-like protein
LSRKRGWVQPICRFCGSASFIRWGWRFNDSGPKQRFRCGSCGRTFVEDDGFVGKRIPPDAICAAWDLFFRAVSLAGISRHLREAWSVKAGERAVLNWVRGYSLLLANYVEAVMEEKKVDGGRRWHEDIAVLKKGRKYRYAFLLRGRGGRGRPMLLATRYAKSRKEEHAVELLKAGVRRTSRLPRKIVSDGEHSFERAYNIVLYQKHREVKLVRGVPIACRKHGLEHNNNPAEQQVRELKDWYRHMNGFSSDDSASDLLRGWMVHVNLVNTHGRAWTWAERAGLHLGLPKEGRTRELIRQAIGWRKSRICSTNR